VRVVDLVLLSLRQLRKNTMRSLLTILGVVIGIAAVTVMVSIGQGGQALIQGEFQNLGSNVLLVFPRWKEAANGVREGRYQTLTPDDARAIADECPAVRATSPLVGAAGAQVISGNANWKPDAVQGVGPDFLIVRNWKMAAGDFFTDRDVVGADKVCVLGDTVRRRLFPGEDPIGQQVRIRNIPFTVVGVLESKGSNLGGQDQDDILLLPYTTARKRLQGSQFSNVDVILVSARSEGQSDQAEKEVTTLLAERHKIPPGRPNDFDVNNTVEIGRIFNIITGSLTAMLSAIAAISLVVGGVGIMNIMLVSVTERTREIGVRKAIGAKRGDILTQFLLEAILLSLVGGLLGVAFGIAGAQLVQARNGWTIVLAPTTILLAFSFSAVVGIFFGFYPALKASKMNPIDALRYE